MRQRLEREGFTNYQVPRDNMTWRDHALRTNVTAAMIAWENPESVLDPACGDGSIALAAHAIRPISKAWLADISAPSIDLLKPRVHPNWEVWTDDIWETFRRVRGKYSMIVLTEILEHVPDPLAVLKEARRHATKLVASSPAMRPGQHDGNSEHLWMFDEVGYSSLLRESGWKPYQETTLRFAAGTYDFFVVMARGGP